MRATLEMRLLRTCIVTVLGFAGILALPATALAAYAPWVAQKSGTTQALRGVAFVDARAGWAVGGGGVILVTSNGGTTWTAQKSGTTQQLNGVAFADADHGWAVGNGGVILRTTNGGDRWTAQKSGTAQQLNGVAFADADTGWAVGGGGVILRTADGGATWRAQTSGTTQALYAVACADASTCWAVGNRATVRRTDDGGATWNAQTAGLKKNAGLRTVGCSGPKVAWIAGGGGAVRKTTDGGSTWAAQSAGTGQWLNGSVASDASHARLVGNSGTVRVTSNGSTWSAEAAPTTLALYAVAGPDAAHAWAVGATGTVLKYSPDLTAPATTATGLQEDDHSGWANASVTVALAATDAGRSGVAATYYRIGGGAQTPYTVPFAVTGEGSHLVSYWSVDQAGNVEDAHSGYVNIDLTGPAAAVAGGVDDAWHAADVTVQLTAGDTGGSGVARIEYRMSGGDAWQPTAADGSFLVDASAVGDGAHVYEFRAVDRAGNAGVTGSCTVKIDVTPPTTTATGLGDEFSGWTDSATTVSLAADDGSGSGVASGAVFYAVNGGAQKPYAAPFVISALGINDVTYWAVDRAGNQEQVRHGYVNIAAYYAKAEGLASDRTSEWHNGPWTVTLTAGGTPASTLSYRVDGGAWVQDQPSPVALQFTTAGSASIEFYAKNTAGQTASQTGYVNIDLTKPVTRLAAPVPTRWMNRDVIVRYTAGDEPGGSGVAATWSAFDGRTVAGTELPFLAPLTHAGDGVFVVRYWSVDSAGNAGLENTYTVRIDTRRPTIAAPYAASVARYGTTRLRFLVKDTKPCAGKATARIVIKNSHKRTVKTLKKRVRTGVVSTAAFTCRLPRGTYRFFVYATDPAGNRQVKVRSNRLTVR